MIDCMTCLVRLAQGCPTNGRTLTFYDVTHAMVTVWCVGSGLEDFPAHNFHWSYDGGRYWTLSHTNLVSLRTLRALWATSNQR